MWESSLISAIAPAVTEGVGEAAIESAIPALTDQALTTGVDQALAGTLTNSLGQSTAGLGMDSVFQALGNNAPMFTADGMLIPASKGMMNIAGLPIDPNTLTPASSGMFGEWGDKAMQVLGSDQFKNATALGVGGFNAINQANAINSAKDIQRQQLEMSKDAYNRDKKADERRQKLVF